MAEQPLDCEGTIGRAGISVMLASPDFELGKRVGGLLELGGISLDIARDGKSVQARTFSGDHDLLLIDVALPGMEGFGLLRTIRRQSRVPVILFAAQATPMDRIAALEAGADDCLAEPFGSEKLVTRIRAVLRRAGVGAFPRETPEILEAAGVELIPSAREVRCAGVGVSLTTTEFDILEVLIRSVGRIVSRDEMTAILHHRRAIPFDRSLDVHVSHLRKKLGIQGKMIVTVRGVGYLFRPPAS